MLFSRDQFARAEHDHLGDRIADYVDGMLSADDEYRADIHLTVCQHCRYAVQQERAIIEQLRSVSFDRGGHESLMAGLLSLAATEPRAPIGAASGKPSTAARPAPAVVTTTAPPQYQSARKSMACALFAVAGCVGVALVASTASGAAQRPETPVPGSPARPALVRSVPSPHSTEIEPQQEQADGSLTQGMPMLMQIAIPRAP